MRLPSTHLIALSAAVLPALAQNSTGGTILNSQVDAFINQVLSDWTSPGGVAVAVVKRNAAGGWDVETKGYGIATANGTKVNEKTLFAIGSNSKVFTSIATGLLIRNESVSPRLSWTSKLASIVPGFGLEDNIATKQATIVDAMSHRTGLPRHDFMYKWSDDVPGIIKRMKSLRPSAEFRDIWQYCNLWYFVLSYLPTVHLPSKIPFARYVKQHIFDPLGLTSTTYSYDVAKASGFLADGMTKEGVNVSRDPFEKGIARIYPYWSQVGGEDGNFISGAGGIISSATDMATWLQALLLNGVKPGTNQSVIPPDVIEKVSTGITVVDGAAALPELSPSVYGGGQGRGTYRGHEIVQHSGGVPGFLSEVARLPSDGLGVAVLTNDGFYGGSFIIAIEYRIIDEALGLEPVDWNSRLRDAVAAQQLSVTPRPSNASLPSANFSAIAGVYNDPGYGRVEFCLLSPPGATASPSCKQLAANVSERFPGTVDPKVPTFMALWDNPFFSHAKMTHFDGNLFNLSQVSSYPTGNASEPYWVEGNLDTDSGALAEISYDGNHHVVGLGITGFWGADASVPPLLGTTIRDRSEAFFTKA